LAIFFLLAQHGTTNENPFNTAADVEAGRLLYRNNCAVCHGITGEGGRGTDLTRGVYRRGSSDEALFRTIQRGIPGTEMPPMFFEGKMMFQLIAYLRSISSGRAAAKATGEAARGRVIFRGKGGCSGCHRAEATGSRVGPDLSDVGARSTCGELESALLRPGEKVMPQNWSVRAVTGDGRRVNGRRLNEDSISVQLIDADERLLSLVKSELREYELIKTSTMPSFEGKLSRSELDDVIAYLAGLRRP
jgi:putative heme-binding domain-containing protein